MDGNNGTYGAKKPPARRTQPITATKKKTKYPKKKKDERAPTKPLSAYNLFFKEEKVRWLDSNKPGMKDDGAPSSRFLAMTKGISERWKQLTKEQKIPFQEAAAKDMKRYRAEQEAYKEELIQDAIHGGDEEKKKKSGTDGHNVLPPDDSKSILNQTHTPTNTTIRQAPTGVGQQLLLPAAGVASCQQAAEATLLLNNRATLLTPTTTNNTSNMRNRASSPGFACLDGWTQQQQQLLLLQQLQQQRHQALLGGRFMSGQGNVPNPPPSSTLARVDALSLSQLNAVNQQHLMQMAALNQEEQQQRAAIQTLLATRSGIGPPPTNLNGGASTSTGRQQGVPSAQLLQWIKILQDGK